MKLGYAEDGLFKPVIRLPGWTRGLCFTAFGSFCGYFARVIPKFSQYAPGLDVNKSQCGIHAVDLKTGKLLGSIIWPSGNQIFAIEAIPGELSSEAFLLFTNPGFQRAKNKISFIVSLYASPMAMAINTSKFITATAEVVND